MTQHSAPTASWPQSFDKLFRSYLTLGEGEEMTPELNPAERGLDSLATVGLLLDLEQAFSVTIPDDLLASLTNADIGGWWALLERAGATADQQADQ